MDFRGEAEEHLELSEHLSREMHTRHHGNIDVGANMNVKPTLVRVKQRQQAPAQTISAYGEHVMPRKKQISQDLWTLGLPSSNNRRSNSITISAPCLHSRDGAICATEHSNSAWRLQKRLVDRRLVVQQNHSHEMDPMNANRTLKLQSISTQEDIFLSEQDRRTLERFIRS